LQPDALHQDWSPAVVSIPCSRPTLRAPWHLIQKWSCWARACGQRFPSAAILAVCLTRGVGIEVMDNRAAARTFSILANEGRRVVAAFLLGS